MSTRSRSLRRGFSLLEIVIAVSVLVLLAGVITLRTGSVLSKSRTAKVLQLYESLRTACGMHHADTGAYAYEYSGYAASSRKLSATQTSAGWAGPYIESPLTAAQNPFGGSIHLYATVTANNWVSGFDTDGDGTEDVTSSGNMLWLSNVDQTAAQRIDSALDSGIPGNWYETGRVRWTSANKQVYLLVYN